VRFEIARLLQPMLFISLAVVVPGSALAFDYARLGCQIEIDQRTSTR